MSKFNIGDKVKVTSEYGAFPAGTQGVVIGYDFRGGEVEPSCALVYVEGSAKGHDGFGKGDTSEGWLLKANGTAWYYAERDLEFANLPVVVAPAAAPRQVTVKKRTKLNPQAQLILDLMYNKGSVTAVEASAVYRVRALPRRIADIKEAGYKVRRVLLKDETGQRYARYYIDAAVMPQPLAA